MKIAIIGATGTIGQRIMNEALERKHEVKALARDPEKIDTNNPNLSATKIAPGRRTGKYRLGTDQLLTNDQGQSYISAEDYAVALLDEIETPQFIRQRFTAVSLEK